MTASAPEAGDFVWTPEAVARFWDWMAASEAMRDHYFARQVGAGVARLLSAAAPVAGREVLDFGSGPGYLVPHLLALGARVSCVDSSAASIAEVEARFGGEPGWGGARQSGADGAPWPDASFDLVCCLETVEHVLEPELPGFLSEILRLLKPGGRALLTTPNDEPLEHERTLCPACGASFHRWQHVRSWTAETLGAQLAGAGFRVVVCRGLDFRRLERRRPVSWLDLSPRRVAVALRDAADRALDAVAPRPFPGGRRLRRLLGDPSGPHLAAVVERPAGGER